MITEILKKHFEDLLKSNSLTKSYTKTARKYLDDKSSIRLIQEILKKATHTLVTGLVRFPELYGKLFEGVRDRLRDVHLNVSVTSKIDDKENILIFIVIEPSSKDIESSVVVRMTFSKITDKSLKVISRFLIQYRKNTINLKADTLPPINFDSLSRDLLYAIHEIFRQIASEAKSL